jgi:iron(III) transport system ATP-binding protein
MIAGFERPTSGRIVLGDRDVTDLPPQRRGLGMVFQNYALFPHLDVFENVAFGLKAQGTPSGETRLRVADALARVELAGYEKRAVQALSGGQQQRVALARALAPEPPLLLLDEPLSNLDAALREKTRDELRSLLKRIGITAIFVTHDQEEAFALSDRIAVLRGGELEQLGTPEELYRFPSNPFVAAFVGRANFVEGNVIARDGVEGVVEVGEGAEWRVRLHQDSGGRVRVMVRPEALRIERKAQTNGTSGLVGQVIDRRFAGANTAYRVRLPSGAEILVTVPGHGSRFDEEEVLITAEQDPPLHAFALESR